MEETKTDEIMPQFDFIECQTRPELIKLLNEKAAKGYMPAWPSHKPMLMAADDYFMILEYHELVDTEEVTNIKAELSEHILEAEFQYGKATSELEEMKRNLNFETDWAQATKEEGFKNPIKTVGDKADYVAKKTKTKQEWADECKRWLAHVKRLEKIRKLPGISPWEKKIEKAVKVEAGYPENSIKLSNIHYCGDDTKKNCNLCLECENGE